MSEPAKSSILGEPLRAELKELLREVLREENGTLGAGGIALQHKEWLTAKEAEKVYGLPATWFEARGREGKIARSKPGRYVLFKRRDIEKYLENGKKPEDENA